MAEKVEQKSNAGKWIFIIAVLLVLALFGLIIAGIIGLVAGIAAFGDFEQAQITAGNVALIPIKGAIIGDKQSPFTKAAASQDIIELIEKADKNPAIKAIIFEINSPGGSAVASEEIAAAVNAVNKTTVAWIRETGASGAYWIASASDVIVASPMSITGSIGVTGSYIQFTGLLERYNLTYQELTAGEYKEVGSPFRDLRDKEREMLQNILNEIHSEFISAVAENRNMPREEVEDIATGMFYTGRQAKELGLIDVLGSKKEAVEHIEKKLNITAHIAEYKRPTNIFELLSHVMSYQSFNIGKGIGESLKENNAVNELEVWV